MHYDELIQLLRSYSSVTTHTANCSSGDDTADLGNLRLTSCMKSWCLSGESSPTNPNSSVTSSLQFFLLGLGGHAVVHHECLWGLPPSEFRCRVIQTGDVRALPTTTHAPSTTPDQSATPNRAKRRKANRSVPRKLVCIPSDMLLVCLFICQPWRCVEEFSAIYGGTLFAYRVGIPNRSR